MIFRKQTKPSPKHPLLIGFSGKQKAGKGVAADYIVKKYDGVRFAFADALKAELYDLNAIRGRDLNEFLKFADAQGRDIDFHGLPRANMNNPRREDKVAWINRFKEEFRELMQVYGDFRRDQDADYFVKRTQVAIEAAITKGAFVVVVDDVRFCNEAKALEDVGFSLCRVQASDETRESRGGISGVDHQSETQLDSYFHSFTVFNNFHLADLFSQLDDVVVQVLNKDA